LGGPSRAAPTPSSTAAACGETSSACACVTRGCVSHRFVVSGEVNWHVELKFANLTILLGRNCYMGSRIHVTFCMLVKRGCMVEI
jgi:hypothetical protein